MSKIRSMSMSLHNVIERRRRRITITRGGSHGQTQRLERSLRSRPPFRRHAALFCADFLHAERCAVLGLVQPYFAVESPCAKFYRTGRRDRCGNLLSIDRRGRIPFSCDSAWIWRRETFSPELARDAAIGLDRSLHRVGCLFPASATVPFAGLACRLQHPGSGRLDRICLRR